MIVYGEILIIENIIMGGALLYITGQIFSAAFPNLQSRLRFAAGCIMCGSFSLVIFFHVNMPLTIIMDGCFAFCVCFVVYGKTKLWQKAVAFLIVTWFMGGMIMALLLVTDAPGIYTASGIYTGDMKAALLSVFAVLCTVTAKQVIRTVSRRKIIQQHSFSVKIAVNGRSMEARGFLDTGNQLREPFSGRPAAVAEERLWQELEKNGMVCEDRFCVLPYQTVGSSGILMAVRTDYVEMEGIYVKGCVIAKGTGVFNMESAESGECRLLLSREMIEGIF